MTPNPTSKIKCADCKKIIGESELTQKELDKRTRLVPILCIECGLR